MRVLVDAGFPRAVHDLVNAAGVEVHRVDSAMSDRQLIEHAANEGYRAIVFLDAEMVSRQELRRAAGEQRVTLVCSASDDPLQAETNFRRWLEAIRDAVAAAPGEVVWLRRDGVRREREPDDAD